MVGLLDRSSQTQGSSRNDGRLFEFQKLQDRTLPNGTVIPSHTWVTRDALEAIGRPAALIDSTVPSDIRALAAIQNSDLMLLGIRDWPPGIESQPFRGNVGLRASLYSLGFMLRSAAADKLDIGVRELKTGLKILPTPSGDLSGQVFLSDTLENGAGYSSYLGDPDRALELLEYICGIGDPNFHGQLVSDEHKLECQTSCHDCIRDYSNLQFHPIIDWRLGLDLARLALDQAADISFNVDYWADLYRLASQSYTNSWPGFTLQTYGDLFAMDNGSEVEIFTHPLWSKSEADFHPGLAKAVARARADGRDYSLKSLFMILRRPF